jgi:SnoaL-like polyketide cyclase
LFSAHVCYDLSPAGGEGSFVKDFGRRFARIIVFVCSGLTLVGCASEKAGMDSSMLNQFATRYTTAWCSQHAASVALFFDEHGSLKINDGTPAIGRAAITNSVQSFMTAFPDIVVKLDRLVVTGAKTEYHWTLTGTNTGPGGTGKFVRISGYEEWRFGSDGLIAESLGHFDAADYEHQLTAGGRPP